MRILAGCIVALVISVSASAALVPVSRNTRLDASASAGATTDTKSAQETTFADFDQTINAGAAAAGATGSATATQRSTLNNGFGGFSANGGASSASTGTGAASSSSLFTVQFMADLAGLHRFTGGMARTGSGEVTAYLRDLTSPPDVFLLHREVTPASGEATENWISDFNLLLGHTYEVSLLAESGPTQGTTSFAVQFNAVPEAGVISLVLPGVAMLMRRRRV